MSTPSASTPRLLSELQWVNRFARLGSEFSTRVAPTALPQSKWFAFSRELSEAMGLDERWMHEPGVLEALSGSGTLKGSEPLASVYSGHQFGVWAGQLGDGRAHYLGEVMTPLGAMELQLKGSGPTPYSRRGDGRAVLRSTVREFLCSEAMAGLGIPTTRALCMVTSPLPVYREELESAAVLTRVAPSFIRFGHFEHFASTQNLSALKTLIQFVLDLNREALKTHLGVDDLAAVSFTDQCLAFLALSTQRYAQLMAQWQGVGFCHGVMNTDNMSILGLTIDYGPFQFMDAFDPEHICNHSDHQGRYRYSQQPQIAYWNLFCLGQAFASLIEDTDQIVQALSHFKTHLPQEIEKVYRSKMGLLSDAFEASEMHTQGSSAQEDSHEGSQEGSQEALGFGGLMQGVLSLMARQRVDHTIFWRQLSQAVKAHTLHGEAAFQPVADLFLEPQEFKGWLERYLARLKFEDIAQSAKVMLKTNPKFVLRNHLCETAIQGAKLGDSKELEVLLRLLSSPFDEHPGFESYADHPPHWAQSISISCSS